MIFSFIIPVYNVQNYLKICLESVLTQTNKEYEIILIDDGSTDDSGKICDEYVKKYPLKIKCIHQQNAGLSEARNVGIKNAQGKYLMMLDSDDYLDNKYFLDGIYPKKTEPDIITFSWKEVPDSKDKNFVKSNSSLQNLQNIYDTGQEYLKAGLKENHLYPWYIWRYLFRKDFWINNNFFFKKGIKYEDVDLTYKILLKAGKIVVHPDVIGCCYRMNRVGSIVYVPNVKAYKDMINIAKTNIEDVLSRIDLDKELSIALCNNFSCMFYSVLASTGFIKKKKDWNSIVNFLNEHKQICKYTKEKKQLFIKLMIDYFGIKLTSHILGLRTRFKYGIR